VTRNKRVEPKEVGKTNCTRREEGRYLADEKGKAGRWGGSIRVVKLVTCSNRPKEGREKEKSGREKKRKRNPVKNTGASEGHEKQTGDPE